MGKKLLISLSGLFLLSILSNAQNEFTATAPSVVRVGEQFQYVVEGSERGEVKLPALNGLQLLGGPYSSYSSHSQWVNGKMTQKTLVSYTYVFRALGEGTIVIPAATVKVGRKEYSTNEVELVVNSASAGTQQGSTGRSEQEDSQEGMQSTSGDEAVFLRVIPSKREVYVGEQLVSALKIHTRVNTRPGSASRDLPYEGFFKLSLDADAGAQQQEINGQIYVTQVIQRHILIPQKSGDLEIEAFESDWMIPQRVQRQRSNNPIDRFFDDPFFDNLQEVPVTISTLPVTIHVKALPPGAPVGFTGAVGNFQVEAQLSAEEVTVNEALSLKITIRGTGNLPLLGEPEVNLPPDHDLYDVTRELNTSTTGNRISGSVTFEYPIVARHAGRFRIAPVQFAWFDPGTNEYLTAQTEEFNFTVLKGEGEDTAEGAIYAPGMLGESVRNLGADIRDISRESPVFMQVDRSLYGTRWYCFFYPLVLLLALVLILLLNLLARRNADLSLVKNRRAARMARSRLKRADRLRKSGETDGFYEEIGKAVWEYLSHKLNIETSGLSREVILEELAEQDVAEDLLHELIRILENSEFSRFAPTHEKSDVNTLYSDAARLIRNLENNLK
jgi:hypothetical protein